MTSTADIPPAYQPAVRDSVDSTAQEARRLAAAGAEESTLVWAKEQTQARDWQGKPVESPRGNLYCALVVRPELTLETAAQLNYVAVVSMGSALASLVSPMMGLRYRCPNQILLNSAVVSEVALHAEANNEQLEWMIIDVRTNVTSHSAADEFANTSLATEGCTDVTAEQVLEAFSRQFLSWVSRWSDEDFEPIRKAWMGRVEDSEFDDTFAPPSLVPGNFDSIDERGNIVLKTDKRTKKVSLREFFSLPG
ncbi:MAG: biotin--[acetyl-CoA-carboxylase] ligase [Gammaproteobacteria bacterium]